MRARFKRALYEVAIGVVCGIVLLVPVFLTVLEII